MTTPTRGSSRCSLLVRIVLSVAATWQRTALDLTITFQFQLVRGRSGRDLNPKMAIRNWQSSRDSVVSTLDCACRSSRLIPSDPACYRLALQPSCNRIPWRLSGPAGNEHGFQIHTTASASGHWADQLEQERSALSRYQQERLRRVPGSCDRWGYCYFRSVGTSAITLAIASSVMPYIS
jgi:hypothetical protein